MKAFILAACALYILSAPVASSTKLALENPQSTTGLDTTLERLNISESAEITCFKTGERQTGQNRICYYDCLGSEYALTLKATQLCPLTIKR